MGKKGEGWGGVDVDVGPRPSKYLYRVQAVLLLLCRGPAELALVGVELKKWSVLEMQCGFLPGFLPGRVLAARFANALTHWAPGEDVRRGGSSRTG